MDQLTLDAIKAELAKHQAAVDAKVKTAEERAAESIAKGKEMDEKIAKLEGAGEDFKRKYFDALNSGRGLNADAHESVDEFIDRGINETAEGAVVSGMRRGNGGEVRRGLAGVRDTRGLMAMRIMRAAAVSFLRKGFMDVDEALVVANRWGDKRAAGAIETTRDLIKDAKGTDVGKREAAERALGSVIVGQGAGFVTPEYYAGFLDFLYPKTVVRRLGAMSLPMNRGSLAIPYLDTAATAAYRGQHQAATDTKPGEAMLQLVEKLLGGQIVMSNELIDEASLAIEVFMRNHLARVMATLFDLKALRGLGAQNEPRGFDWWLDNSINPMAPSANKYNRTLAGGVPTGKTIRADLEKAQQVVEEQDVDLEAGRGGYVMVVREKHGLRRVTDSYDRLIFADEMKGGTLLGYPFAATTQLPKTLAGDAAGAGTGNKSRVYFADFSTVVVAEKEGVQVEVQRGGAYKDVNGNVQAGLSNNETVLAMFQRHDLGFLYRGKEGSIVDSVDWGVQF
jgi:HK97 family phage major capsid protein